MRYLMRTALNPHWKLALATAALVLLSATVAFSSARLSGALVARIALALAVVGVAVVWLRRGSPRSSGPQPVPRLRVVARAGLSSRSALALIEVDGRAHLVVHGDGFAHLQRLSPELPREEAGSGGRKFTLERVS